jgi:hypothetical protein
MHGGEEPARQAAPRSQQTGKRMPYAVVTLRGVSYILIKTHFIQLKICTPAKHSFAPYGHG